MSSVQKNFFVPDDGSEETLEANSHCAQELKRQFPLFDERPDIIYLDSAATTQKPLAVLDAERDFYLRSCANVHRAIHALGEEATARYEDARKTMARFIGATPTETIFTRGTTESINLVARTFGETLQAGDEIILSVMEHHANMVPWQQLAERRGVVLKFVPVTDSGELDLEAYYQLLGPKTRLVAVTMISNVLGTINPIERIIRAAHELSVPVLLDAAQAAPSMPLDVKALDADFLAFSGHKMYGPFGIGVLYGKAQLLDAMPAFMGGGDMISEVRLDGFSVNELPYKFEAGTPPISQAVGLAAAANWLIGPGGGNTAGGPHGEGGGIGLEALGQYEGALARRFLAQIEQITGVQVLGHAKSRAGIVAFTLEGVHAHDLAAYLDRHTVAVRAGHHCAHPLARRFGIISSARASFGVYNTIRDVDEAAKALSLAREML
ncbi:MAG TPA: cysteine desulfurase [Spirochaetales bacterium]|nr:cysteine desulfurase [Spirochaetales bacterium]